MTACAQNKIRFGKKNNPTQNKIEAESGVVINENKEISQNNDLASSNEEIADVKKTKDNRPILIEKLNAKLSSLDKDNSGNLQEVLQQTDAIQQIVNLGERKDEKDLPRLGVRFLVIGIILLLIALAFWTMVGTATVDEPDLAGGCIESLIGIIAYALIGVIFGIAGIAGIIIGIILMKGRGKRKKQKTQSEQKIE
jgi:hypothetical protein